METLNEENDYNYVSSELIEWMVNFFSIKKDDSTIQLKEVFYDSEGKLRYKSTWEEVKSENDINFLREKSVDSLYLNSLSPDVQIEYKRSGRIRVNSNINPSKHTKSDNSVFNELNRSQSISESQSVDGIQNKGPIPLLFLVDYQKLWNFYLEDPSDEISLYAPLFIRVIELLYHKRTFYFVIALTFYNFCSRLILDMIFIKYIIVSTELIFLFSLFFECAAYLAILSLYKGSILDYITKDGKDDDDDTDKYDEGNNRVIKKFQSGGRRQRKEEISWKSSFYLVVRLSLKEIRNLKKIFKTPRPSRDSKDNPNLIDLLNVSLKFLDNHCHMDVSEFNKPFYRLLLLFSLICFPLYCVLQPLSNIQSTIQAFQYCPSVTTDPICEYILIQCMIQLGSATVILQTFFFGFSVLLGIVGMAYGSELAFQIVFSWVHRYFPVRKLHLTSLKDDQNIFYLQPDNPKDLSEDPEAGMGSMDPKNKYLRHWNLISETALDPKDTIPFIKRDSFEHYLFIREYMIRAGEIWSPTLVYFFTVAFYIVISFFAIVYPTYSAYLTKGQLIHLILFFSIRGFILIILPILCVAHANNFVFKIIEAFNDATPDDFQMIGGKESWNKFLADVPAVWSFYGLWITWDKISGIVSSFLLAFLSLISTYIWSHL